MNLWINYVIRITYEESIYIDQLIIFKGFLLPAVALLIY